MVEYYSNDSQKLLPGLNILVQLYYHHIVEEYNSNSEFQTSKSTCTTMTLAGNSQNIINFEYTCKSLLSPYIKGIQHMFIFQILHCLKDQWWALGPLLWAYGLIHPLNTINQLRIPSWATLIFFTTPKFCTV